ncbi:hypothetical protein [Spiroplasma sp. BIUS-1]|uniref:hypothetical protein n=1 Tax=Spiroplasma sp. BIUS-1 TaxID=216964 RepID=UPI00139957FB|nr:hypothetical protein [Spiroplasma sp. BIUS-1]QHX36325.1 hypothetical protein SBIUS_v1c00720 [Spiroplasma sp. BIUS-1]
MNFKKNKKINLDETLFLQLKNNLNEDNDLKSGISKFIWNRNLSIILPTILTLLFLVGALLFMLLEGKVETNIRKMFLFIGLGAMVLLPFQMIISYLLNKKLQKKLNLIIHTKGNLKKIYETFFNQNNDLKNIEKVEYKSLNPDFSTNKFYGSHNEYLSQVGPAKKRDNLNLLSFKFNGKEGSFIIQEPVKCIKRTRSRRSDGSFRWKTNTTLVSMDSIFIVDDKIKNECNGLRIRSKGILKGDYQTESVAFNQKYSTNIAATNIAGAKFLNPIALDRLSNLNDDNFFALGVNEDVYIQKYFIKNPIYPIGIFDFTKLSSKNKLYEYMTRKIQFEKDLFKRSLEYISFIK